MTLSTLEIRHAKPGMHADGNGLYLYVTKSGGKSWIFRYQVKGRRREMGLGALTDLTVTQARARAEEMKDVVKAKRDPLEERRIEAEKAAAEAKELAVLDARNRLTFRAVALEFIEAHKAGWKNRKHAQQWENTLKTYAFPHVGDLPIDALDTDHILKVLRPIWESRAETASRVRSRIELVISYAKARGWFRGENPATWRGHLSALLPAPSKIKRVRHHPALPWRNVAQMIDALRKRPGSAARALEFAILTAARSGEVRGARWSEINTSEKLWTIPGSRMKAGKEHRVPLSASALTLLGALPRMDDEELVFPGNRRGRPLSDMSLSAVLKRMNLAHITVHGFRSTFRDWAAEATLHHPDIVEMALAHTIQNKVEAAYRRSDLIEKRRTLMEDWASWCSGR